MKNIDDVKEKSSYCLSCKIKPCSLKGCPLNNNIPEFIKAIKEEKYEEAYNILSETTVLQPICGRICPHMKQCQGNCVRGIKGEPVSIGDLEVFIGDMAIENNYKIKFRQNESENQEKSICQESLSQLEEPQNTKVNQEKNKSKKIAIIGGGPAGLTCAAFLKKYGDFDVTIYEKYDYLGGLLVHGIPEFRLPKKIVKETVNKILDLGIKVEFNTELGRNLSLSELQNTNDAVFLAFGANISTKMEVQGEDLQGVYGGNELLEKKLHPDYKDKKVAVIGGGNVAMDCARTIKNLGAKEVKVIYRRAEEQMPAERKEIEDAKEEGIEFLFQNNIVKIIGNEKVQKVELIKTELVQKEGETRLVPVNVENSNYEIDIDYIIMALGSRPEGFVKELGLELAQNGKIIVNDKYQTSNPKIFAGGDIAGAKGTVAWAAREGRDAAESIAEFLES